MSSAGTCCQLLTGQSPEQPRCADPGLEQGLGTSRGAHQPTLWFGIAAFTSCLGGERRGDRTQACHSSWLLWVPPGAHSHKKDPALSCPPTRLLTPLSAGAANSRVATHGCQVARTSRRGQPRVGAHPAELDQPDARVRADLTNNMFLHCRACPGRAQTWPESLGAARGRWHQEDSVPSASAFPLFIKHKSRSQSAEAPRLRRVTVKKWEMKPASKDLGLSSCPTERVKELTCSLL